MASVVGSTDYKSAVGNIVFGLGITIALAVLLFIFTYLEIEGSNLRYVNMLFQRHTVDIQRIREINKGRNAFFFPRLYVYFEQGDVLRRMNIYDSFSDKTKTQFLRDIKALNPKISM